MSITDLEDDGRDMNPLAPAWENTQGTIEGEKAAEEFTPTTDQVRLAYAQNYVRHVEYHEAGVWEFDRWLAAHDADLTARLTAEIMADWDRGEKQLGDHIADLTARLAAATAEIARLVEHAEGEAEESQEDARQRLDLTARLAEAEATIAKVTALPPVFYLKVRRNGFTVEDFSRPLLEQKAMLEVVSAYRPVAAHPEVDRG